MKEDLSAPYPVDSENGELDTVALRKWVFHPSPNRESKLGFLRVRPSAKITPRYLKR